MSDTHALERALLAEHARLHPPAPARRWLSGPRAALAGVGLGVAVAAACQVPVDYQREFGASVSCMLPPKTWVGGELDDVADMLAETFAAEGVAMDMHEEDGVRSFRVDLWGAEVDDVRLIAALRGAAPELPASACVRTPLIGTVHGTLGGRLGHDFLDIELDGDDAEAARLKILQALAREGVEGDAEVEVHDDGAGRRAVKVHIEAHRREPAARE